MVNIDDLQNICSKLRGVTSDVKWGNDLCFNIGGKMFLVTSLDKVPTSASFKVTEDQFDEMIELDIFTPAPYLARYKWIAIQDIGSLGLEMWARYIHTSYSLVSSKLPKKVKLELGLI